MPHGARLVKSGVTCLPRSQDDTPTAICNGSLTLAAEAGFGRLSGCPRKFVGGVRRPS